MLAIGARASSTSNTTSTLPRASFSLRSALAMWPGYHCTRRPPSSGASCLPRNSSLRAPLLPLPSTSASTAPALSLEAAAAEVQSSAARCREA